MRTEKEVLDYLKAQEWYKEFRSAVINNLGCTVAEYIKSCNGDYRKFFSDTKVKGYMDWVDFYKFIGL